MAVAAIQRSLSLKPMGHGAICLRQGSANSRDDATTVIDIEQIHHQNSAGDRVS